METAERPRAVHSAFIAEELEREIIDQRLPAGSKLDEVALARRFGVSRTPVREALHVVVSRSLAARVPYKGVVVADITRERIGEMFEAMAEVEAICGRFAADRMTADERSHLEALHGGMRILAARGEVRCYEQANTQFHSAIFAGTHNPDLIEIAHGLRIKLAPFRSSQLQAAKRIVRSSEEHHAIVQALLARDVREAGKAMKRHLLHAARAVLASRG